MNGNQIACYGLDQSFVLLNVHKREPGTGDTFVASVPIIVSEPGTGDTFVAAFPIIVREPGTGDTFVAAFHIIVREPGTGDTSVAINRKVDTSFPHDRYRDRIICEFEGEPCTISL